jgi:hypothetical protein
MPVKAGQHHDFLLGHNVENAVGKAAQQGTPNVAVNDPEPQRIPRDDFETLVKRLDELITELMTSVAVPRENPLDVRFGRGREAQGHFLRTSRSRT